MASLRRERLSLQCRYVRTQTLHCAPFLSILISSKRKGCPISGSADLPLQFDDRGLLLISIFPCRHRTCRSLQSRLFIEASNYYSTTPKLWGKVAPVCVEDVAAQEEEHANNYLRLPEKHVSVHMVNSLDTLFFAASCLHISLETDSSSRSDASSQAQAQALGSSSAVKMDADRNKKTKRSRRRGKVPPPLQPSPSLPATGSSVPLPLSRQGRNTLRNSLSAVRRNP